MRRSRSSRPFALAVAGGSLVTSLAASAAVAQPAPAARYAVTGSVRDADDARVAGAIVEVLGPGPAARHATTGADGAFRLGDLGAGALLLRVRRLGFRPETLQLEVPQIDGGAVIVPLERVAQPLARVSVRAQGGAAAARTPFLAFERRRAAGLGRFVTRADIEKRHPQRTTDIFRSMAGVVVEAGDGGTLVPHFRNAMMGRRACDPFYWLDGSPLGALPLDLDAISPSAIEGIEVYSGIATVPSALRGPSSTAACGVIAVWTRRGGPRGGPGSVSSAELAALVERGDVFTADQVDEPAAALPLVPFAPLYPDSLRQVPGRVVAEFVVDAAGDVEGETVGFVSATRSAFADAVRLALPGVKFSPAVRKGRAVRQVVQWPVTFEPQARDR